MYNKTNSKLPVVSIAYSKNRVSYGQTGDATHYDIDKYLVVWHGMEKFGPFEVDGESLLFPSIENPSRKTIHPRVLSSVKIHISYL